MKLSLGHRLILFGKTLFAKETPVGLKLLMIGAIVYGVSPFDAVPDVIPLAGISDDAIVLAATVYYIWQKTRVIRRKIATTSEK